MGECVTECVTNESNRCLADGALPPLAGRGIEQEIRPHGNRTPVQSVALADLDFGRNLWIHQRCAAVRVNHLSRDPASLVRTEKSDDISYVLWCSQASHRRPTAGVPVSNEGLDLFRQAVQDAVFRPPRAYRINCDTAPCNGHGEVTDEGFQRRFR